MKSCYIIECSTYVTLCKINMDACHLKMSDISEILERNELTIVDYDTDVNTLDEYVFIQK